MMQSPEREVQAGHLGAGWRVWWQKRWHRITRSQLIPASSFDPTVRIVLVTSSRVPGTGRGKRTFIVNAAHFVAAERTESE